ncbi:MAG: tRNA lysidine(34) synthetase TilS [Bdellovibrio sp.]|nr:tRNA lysidine(34) synthetase TilS [Bdellovibrio sp.]
MNTNYYPKPSPMGGVLIRRVVSFLRSQRVHLPIHSHILIATSGGNDSITLAHLLITYGRRVISKNKIKILHINHRWRGKASDLDAKFVRKLAKKWGVKFYLKQLPYVNLNQKINNNSLENLARIKRKEIFYNFVKNKKLGKYIFTAHHADDLVETVLWRFFTGTINTHGAGILFKSGVELRPFLQIRKKELLEYLKQEKIPWREDITNQDDRFLRVQIRKQLLPLVEKIFPRVVQNLLNNTLPKQKKFSKFITSKNANNIFSLLNIRIKKSHLEIIKNINSNGTKKISIPLRGGWCLNKGYKM